MAYNWLPYEKSSHLDSGEGIISPSSFVILFQSPVFVSLLIGSGFIPISNSIGGCLCNP